MFPLNPSGHAICVIGPGNLIGCAAHFFRRIFYSNTDACPADHINVIFRISKGNGCLLWNLQIVCQKSKGGRFPCFFIRYFQQGWHRRSQIDPLYLLRYDSSQCCFGPFISHNNIQTVQFFFVLQQKCKNIFHRAAGTFYVGYRIEACSE